MPKAPAQPQAPLVLQKPAQTLSDRFGDGTTQEPGVDPGSHEAPGHSQTADPESHEAPGHAKTAKTATRHQASNSQPRGSDNTASAGGGAGAAASTAFDLRSAIRKGDDEAQKAQRRRVRFAIDPGTPAPPPPARSEAWPGGVLVTPNKAEALAAFHARKGASAGTATAAATEAAAAAAAAAADFGSGTQPRQQRQRREGTATAAAAGQQQPPPDRCAFFYSHEIGEYACFSQFFHSEFTDGNQIYSCM